MADENEQTLEDLEAEAAGDDSSKSKRSGSVDGEHIPAGQAGSDYRQEAQFLIDGALDFIGSNVGIRYDEATRAKGVDRLTPVLQKHQGQAPDWMLPVLAVGKKYREEFLFGAWCAGIAWQTIKVLDEAQKQGNGAEAKDGREAQPENPDKKPEHTVE